LGERETEKRSLFLTLENKKSSRKKIIQRDSMKRSKELKAVKEIKGGRIFLYFLQRFSPKMRESSIFYIDNDVIHHVKTRES
jgi:hypothetical protein